MGWSVNDGGGLAIVTNPDGMILGGEFAGVQVPLTYGDYRVDRPSSPIVLSFQSPQPILLAPDWKTLINFESNNQEHGGGGPAIGATLPIQLPDGRLVFDTRNIITFPLFGEEVESLLPH